MTRPFDRDFPQRPLVSLGVPGALSVRAISHALALFRCHLSIAISQHIPAIPIHLAVTTIVVTNSLLLGGRKIVKCLGTFANQVASGVR